MSVIPSVTEDLLTVPISPEADPYDVRLVQGASDLLAEFNRAGVLGPADVHVAVRLAGLAGESDEAVILAVALAVRAPRYGHTRLDLATVAASAAADVEELVDLDGLPWPDPGTWVERVAASPLVARDEGAGARSSGAGGAEPPDGAGARSPDGAGARSSGGAEAGQPENAGVRPLRLRGSFLYLDRHWRDEVAVAEELLRRSATPDVTVEPTALEEALRRILPDGGDQARAAGSVARRSLTVIAGGPGTGKTTTVARAVAVLDELWNRASEPPLLVALTAPTGKAAARLGEAIRSEADALAGAGVVDDATARRLGTTSAGTIHRLLKRQPGSSSRFRHHRLNHLPHDVVIVDETSMIPMWLMARLLEAVRPDARLVLVGDPDQLASVEAGAVFSDVARGPVETGDDAGATAVVTSGATGGETAGASATASTGASTMASAMLSLRRNFRFSGPLAELAAAVQGGDADAAIELLATGHEDLVWIERPGEPEPQPGLESVRQLAVDHGRRMWGAATTADAEAALGELGQLRVLCAHRRGPAGVGAWNERVESWLADAVPGVVSGAWHAGRPVIVTRNDYTLRLYNGDTGVAVVRDGRHLEVVFDAPDGMARYPPSRLADIDTAHVMTVHKAQGSEFEVAVVALPPPESRVLTRQLLYTAVTRARRRLVLVGTEASVRAAVGNPVARSSGLAERLWA